MSDIYLKEYAELINNIVQSYKANDRITCRMYMEEHDAKIMEKFRKDLFHLDQKWKKKMEGDGS